MSQASGDIRSAGSPVGASGGVTPSFSERLSVSLRPSRFLALALTAIAVTALVCAWIGLPRPAFAPVALGILLAWAWHLRRALQRGGSAIHSLELRATGELRYEDGQGRWQEAEILPGGYVSGWLIVVMLGAGGRGRVAVVLLPDSADPGELRHLRAWLRWRLARP
ncbi:MAG: hypothetical protein IH604_20815 [Burkholderiales bacterium]|nr:hypothetical protein [Burkholderiales bacterium]